MKKSTFTILLAMLFVVKGLAQQVEEKQRSLVTKRTADWCTFCGGWGWNFFKNAIEQNGDKAIYVAAHYSGGLMTDVAEAITENFGGGYQPRFFLDETDIGATSGNASSKLSELSTQINSAFNAAPIANSGFVPSFSNGEIKVNAKAKFFQAAQGEFYLGLYLIEDHVISSQASQGANADHRYLLRGGFGSETFGQLLANGSVDAGQEFNLQFSTPVAEIENHEYSVLGIIWKKEGTKYIPVNVWSTNNIQTVSATTIENPANRMVVFPNVANETARINVEITKDQTNASIEVLDLNGRVVSTIFKGTLTGRGQLFEVSKNEVGGNGLYFIRLSTPEFVVVEKVIFQ